MKYSCRDILKIDQLFHEFNFIIFQDSVKLTDLDKLYLALAETKEEPVFDILYYGLDITSIKALKEYSVFEAKKFFFSDDSFERLKHKICDRHFDFHELAQVTKIVVFNLDFQ